MRLHSTSQGIVPMRSVLGAGGLCLALTVFLGGGTPAAAQGLGVDYGIHGAPMASFIAGSYLQRSYITSNAQKMAEEAKGRGKAKTPGTDKITIAPGQGIAATTVQEMSTRVPPEQRPRLEKAFRECFAQYTRLESRLGLPKDDVAGAMAAFIAGNYMALHDRAIPDAHFLVTVRQIRAMLAGNADFRRAGQAEKRQIYEQLATVGMFMALAQRDFEQHPNPQGKAKLREQARGQLEQFLQRPALALQITASGLSLS